LRRIAPLAAALALLLGAAPAAADVPRTGFEQRDGASFTTHDEELAFLAAVAAGSPRVRVTEIGRTKQRRPLQLVELGAPAPAGLAAAQSRPTALMVCSQHGNEPAGREACLQLLRDLAFTADPALVGLLERTTFLFVPSANPDGRAENTRENSDGVDVNRDHLALDTPEARAVAGVVRDWRPDVVVDLHEYGPSMPVLYDDSVLWLWPRNLNTDEQVHDLAVELGRKYLVPAANAAGYTTDEYGQYEVADNDVQQTAGDGDEGIARNAMGLRHALGILVETRVDADVRQSPTEPALTAEVARRRVASHVAVLGGLVRFMNERGADAARVTAGAAERKAGEGAARSAPVYFGGADNEEPAPEQVVTPPPCGYGLTPQQLAELGPRLDLHGIFAFQDGGRTIVPLGQAAEPLIALLLDDRGARNVVSATALGACPAPPGPAPVPAAPAGAAPSAPGAAASKRCTRRRSVLLRVPRVRGAKLLRRTVRVGGRRAKVRRGGIVVVRLDRARKRVVRVRIVQRVRTKAGKVRTRRTTRTFRLCPRR
jgi:hypothetical protein